MSALTPTPTHSEDPRVADRVPVELVVLDMAGTTVLDDGIVERAFQRAAERTGVADRMPWPEALQYVRDTMGQSKIDVFTHLAGGDRAAAERATAQFEDAYAEIVSEDGAHEIPGAAAAIRTFRAQGIAVALTTGFSPATRDVLLDALGWRDLVDVALSPVDAGRGRPAPDLVLTALLRTGVSAVQAVAVAGDTTSDVESGRRAGAGFVAGVLSGAHGRTALEVAGADAVLDDVTALAAALAERELLPSGVALARTR
ncbi:MULTISPECIES: phosphonatase-like hydrolase [unclassified Microbacterium]|uniref:phosphonatase-like hydrolase n=1 Tax=unclassified Microbacterium TaxID=2609290 RepID=UPI00300FE0C2